MSNQEFWCETLHKDLGQYFTIKNKLYHGATGKQNLAIFENEIIGRVMTLDGIVQTTEYDEFIYHEMITHVPIIAHNNVKKVLIIGGGDGGVLREVSRYPYIKQITMVEIDAEVISFCKKYLPQHNAGAFKDPRLALIIEDGIEFISKNHEKFDVIISDSTDPIGPGKKLFTSIFYKGCLNSLDEGGVFVAQNGVCFLQQNEVINSYHKLTRYFSDVSFYQAAIPTYYGGIMTFAWASKNSKLRQIDVETIAKRINNVGLNCRYYNAKIHNGSFALPQYLLNAISASY